MEDALAYGVAQAAGQPATVRIGTIIATTPLIIDLDGTALLNESVGCVSSYLPRAGDVVALLGQSVAGADSFASSWTILGANTNSDASVSGRGGLQVMAAVQAEGAGTFINLTGLTFPFTKRRDGSLIHGRFGGSAFSSAVGLGGEFAAQILDAAGAQVGFKVLASRFYNFAADHGVFIGFDDIPGIPAGSYTVQGQFRKYVGGAGNIQTDTNDRMSLYFDEV